MIGSTWRWLHLFVERFNAARVPILAASLAYYATLSLFPLLLLAFAGFGFALSRYPNLKDEILRFLSSAVEQAFPSAAALLEETLRGLQRDLLERFQESAGVTGLIGVGSLIWAASGFFAALQVALSLAIPGTRTRSVVIQRGIALLSLFTLAPLMLTLMLVGALLSSLSSLPFLTSLQGYASSGLAVLGAFVLFGLSYHYLPAHTPSWRASFLAALPAALVWQVARVSLGLLTPLTGFQATYGILAGFLLLLVWLYLSMQIFLMGGVLVSLLEQQGQPVATLEAESAN